MSSAGFSNSIAASYFPYEGNYSTYLEKKAKRLEQEDREESGQQKAMQRRARVDPAGPKAPPDQEQGAYPQVRATGRNARTTAPIGKAQIVIQVPERLGGKVIEVKNVSKAYGDKLLFEDLSFTLPRAASSASSGRTAPASPPCSS